MKPAQVIVSGKARALACGLTLVLALGGAAPAPPAAAATFATGDHLIVTEDATWHYDPGQSAGFTVPAGDDVYVLDGPSDGEYYVAWGSDKGWLDGGDLAPADGSSAGNEGGSSPSAGAGTPGADGAGLTEGELTGSDVQVAHTGNGVNLRAQPRHDADILDKLPDGTVLQLRIDQTDTVYDPDGTTRWWPVRYNGEDGWIAGFYLAPASGATTSGSASTGASSKTTSGNAAASAATGLSEDELTGSSVRVANSGNGVNLRATPSDSGNVLDKLSEGTVVQLRIDETDTVVADGHRWWPVRSSGKDGWIAGDYLAPVASQAPSASQTPSASISSGNTSSSGKAASTSTGLSADQLTGSSVRVANSGNGVNLRAKPSDSGSVVDKLSEGTVVQLRIDQTDTVVADGHRWWPVSYNGEDGWIVGDYLAPVAGPASSTSSTSSTNSSATAATFGAGDYVAAKTRSGSGANIRAAADPGADKVGYIAEGDVVQVMSGPVADGQGSSWYKVTNGAVTGYVDGDLLTRASQPTPPNSEQSAAFTAGDYAAAQTPGGVGINLRDDASLSAGKVGFLAERGVAKVVSGPVFDSSGTPWYEVTANGVSGYADGAYLIPASAPPAASASAVAAASSSSSGFIYPLASFTLTQGYGCTGVSIEPYDAALGCNFHNAIDLAAPSYTPIMAAAAGTVVYAGWCDCGLGYMVEIDHGNGFHTVYGHMAQQPYVSVGQSVSQGETIGPVGSTGNSTGPHVHFEIVLNGNTVDPLSYLP